MIIVLEMIKKPVRDAGETTLLLCAGDMERETAQMSMLERGMLGTLGWLIHRDDAFVRQESDVAGTVPCQYSNSTAIYFIIQASHSHGTGLRYQLYNIDSAIQVTFKFFLVCLSCPMKVSPYPLIDELTQNNE